MLTGYSAVVNHDYSIAHYKSNTYLFFTTLPHLVVLGSTIAPLTSLSVLLALMGFLEIRVGVCVDVCVGVEGAGVCVSVEVSVSEDSSAFEATASRLRNL